MRRICCVLCAIAILQAAGQANAQDRPLRIAIYRPLSVMQNSKEYADLKQKFDAESAQLETERLKKEEEIKGMIAQQHNLKPDSAAFAEMTNKIERASAELDVWKRVVQDEGQRVQNRAVVALYQRIEAAATAVARQENYDLVLMDWYQDPPQPPELDHLTTRDLLRTLAQRGISSASRAPDITEKVLLRAETEYSKTKNPPK